MGLPSTLPPKSSTAICAAVTEPLPVGEDAGPFMSVRTPILTTSSETCACPADGDSSAAASKPNPASFPGVISRLVVRIIMFPPCGTLAVSRVGIDLSRPLCASHPGGSCQNRRCMVHHPRMTTTQRLPPSLTPLDDALAMLLDRLEPVAAIDLALTEA